MLRFVINRIADKVSTRRGVSAFQGSERTSLIMQVDPNISAADTIFSLTHAVYSFDDRVQSKNLYPLVISIMKDVDDKVRHQEIKP